MKSTVFAPNSSQPITCSVFYTRLSFFAAVIFAFILFSCSGSKPSPTIKENAAIPLKERFVYTNHGAYKTIHVFSDKKTDDTTFSYVLYHRGTVKPAVNFKAQFIETPVSRVACLSNIYVGCMEKLGLLHEVIAVDNKNYICNPYIRKKIEAGEIKELAKSEALDIEQTLLLNPGLIITYGTGITEKDANQKLTDAGIPFAISIDHLETSPLARASWLKFVAAFFEKEQLADSLIMLTEKNYEDLKKLSLAVERRPTAISEAKYNDTWYVPGGKSFMSVLLRDAGADYFWKDDPHSGSLALAYEEVYLNAREADFWLNVHSWNSLDDCAKQDARNKNFKAYQNKNIYNNDAIRNGEGGNAYWETGLLSPDEILKDMIKIFHPDLLPQHQLKYYRRLN